MRDGQLSSCVRYRVSLPEQLRAMHTEYALIYLIGLFYAGLAEERLAIRVLGTCSETIFPFMQRFSSVPLRGPLPFDSGHRRWVRWANLAANVTLYGALLCLAVVEWLWALGMPEARVITVLSVLFIVGQCVWGYYLWHRPRAERARPSQAVPLPLAPRS